jgi:hypothetical protein
MNEKARDGTQIKPGRESRFEILWNAPEADAGRLQALRRTIDPYLTAGGAALGDLYAAAARRVLERLEDFEDRQVERSFRARRAARRNLKSGG